MAWQVKLQKCNKQWQQYNRIDEMQKYTWMPEFNVNKTIGQELELKLMSDT